MGGLTHRQHPVAAEGGCRSPAEAARGDWSPSAGAERWRQGAVEGTVGVAG